MPYTRIDESRTVIPCWPIQLIPSLRVSHPSYEWENFNKWSHNPPLRICKVLGITFAKNLGLFSSHVDLSLERGFLLACYRIQLLKRWRRKKDAVALFIDACISAVFYCSSVYGNHLKQARVLKIQKLLRKLAKIQGTCPNTLDHLMFEHCNHIGATMHSNINL